MELLRENWNENLLKIRPEIKNIFYKGEVDLILNNKPKLAVVGSRRMTEYGARVIEKWMPSLVEAGITIVSGFMYGVDQMAHKTCLENGGKTIAVLGYGIDMPVAGDDRNLYHKIVEVNSLIVSEYPGKFPANKWTFPQRNRIVAGISDAVLVVEGAKDSGSMITARLAGVCGKKLLALPGQITNKVSGGTNDLIRQGKARIVTSAEELLVEMGLVGGQLKFSDTQRNPLMDLLSETERGVDEISKILMLDVPQVLVKLTELALADLIEEKHGKYRLK